MPTPIHSAEDLGRAIRAARSERGITQDSLALASGTGRRFIGELEQGKPTMRIGTLLRVLSALNMRLELRDDRSGGAWRA